MTTDQKGPIVLPKRRNVAKMSRSTGTPRKNSRTIVAGTEMMRFEERRRRAKTTPTARASTEATAATLRVASMPSRRTSWICVNVNGYHFSGSS